MLVHVLHAQTDLDPGGEHLDLDTVAPGHHLLHIVDPALPPELADMHQTLNLPSEAHQLNNAAKLCDVLHIDNVLLLRTLPLVKHGHYPRNHLMQSLQVLLSDARLPAHLVHTTNL